MNNCGSFFACFPCPGAAIKFTEDKKITFFNLTHAGSFPQQTPGIV
jgi:hypothetical protein